MNDEDEADELQAALDIAHTIIRQQGVDIVNLKAELSNAHVRLADQDAMRALVQRLVSEGYSMGRDHRLVPKAVLMALCELLGINMDTNGDYVLCS